MIWLVIDGGEDVISDGFETKKAAEDWLKSAVADGSVPVYGRYAFAKIDLPWVTPKIVIEEAKEQG